MNGGEILKAISHAIVGAATGFILSEFTGSEIWATIGITVLASLIPDIDEEHSTINKILFPVKVKRKNYLKIGIGIGMMLINSTILRYLGVIILLSTISAKVEYRFSLFRGFEKLKYHRTLFHHPLFGGIIFIAPLIILNIPSYYKVAFIVGLIVGHYLMDSFTTYGLPLYPFRYKPLRMPIHFNSSNRLAEVLVISIYVAITLIPNHPQLISLANKLFR